MLKKLYLPQPNALTTDSSSKMSISNVVSTNYPEPCSLCKLNQCETDDPHTIYFTVFKSLDEAFAKYNKKPPDVS